MIRLFALLPCLVLFAACGPSGPVTYPVSGTVTFDGKPVEKGLIVFSSPDGKMNPDSGEIKDGKFSFPAQPGKKKVEIRANREGAFDPVMNSKKSIAYIPTKYNDTTELTAEVTDDTAKNVFEFKLVP